MTKVQDSTDVVDIDTRDFTLAIDGLVEEQRMLIDSYLYSPIPKKVKGVKISASEPRCVDIEVPRRHLAFTKGKPSEMAQLMKFGLRTLPYPSTEPAPVALPAPPSTHSLAHIDLDTASSGFGGYLEAFKDETASVLVVHDTKLAGVTRAMPDAHQLESFIMKIIQNNILPDLQHTGVGRGDRRSAITMAVNTSVGGLRMLQKYGSFEAADAARGKEWRFGEEGHVIDLL